MGYYSASAAIICTKLSYETNKKRLQKSYAIFKPMQKKYDYFCY